MRPTAEEVKEVNPAKGTVLMLISALCYGVSLLVKIQFDFGLNSSSVLMYRRLAA